MKVVLVAYHFKPDEAIGAIRPENWAKWLGEEYEVIVITRETPNQFHKGENSNYSTIRPSSFGIRLLDKLNQWRKQRRTYRAHAHRPSHPSENSGHAQPSSGIFSYRMPCFHDLWLLAGLSAVHRCRPDLIIASHSPYINILIAYFYALYNPKVNIWLDFRDLWVDNHRAIGSYGIRRIETFLEKSAVGRSKVITTVSKGLGKLLQKRYPTATIEVIYNSPLDSLPERVDDDMSRTKDHEGIVLCYTGTIYSGWQDPSPLFDLLAQLRRQMDLRPKDIKLIFASRNPGNLLHLADKFQVSDYVDYRGAVSRDESIRIQRGSDILLLLESTEPSAAGVLTGKVFEYLSTDKPILLIGPGPNSELYQLLNKHHRLITLQEFETVLRSGSKMLPHYEPANYVDISKELVLSTAHAIDTLKHS